MGIETVCNTQTEIAFLRNLGTHTCERKNPLPLLKKYLSTAMRREVWGDINKEEVMKEAKRLIKELKK